MRNSVGHQTRRPAFRASPDTESATKLAASVVDIASLPMACTRVTHLANDPQSSAQEIAEVVSLDPGLSGRLLKLVNSAYYALPDKVDTVSSAVRVLGTDALRNLALATGAIATLNKIGNELVDMEEFWRTSVHCALLSRELSRVVFRSSPEQFFAIGLLHGIGQLVMASQAPDHTLEVRKRLRVPGAQRVATELDVFGFSFADVGAELMQAWQLPASLSEPVRYQVRPVQAAGYGIDAAIVHIASSLSELEKLRGVEPYAAQLVVESAVWRLAGLVEDVAARVLDDVDEQWFEVLEILSPGSFSIRY